MSLEQKRRLNKVELIHS